MDTEPNLVTSLKVKVNNDYRNGTEEPMEDEEMEEGEASSDEHEEGEASSEDEVEVNVIVPNVKSRVIRNAKKYDDDDDLKRKYTKNHDINNDNPFRKSPEAQTDFDGWLSRKMDGYLGRIKEDTEDLALKERAKRFGIPVNAEKPQITRECIRNLYKSLDITEDDFSRGGWRAEAVHVRGMNSLGSKEIFKYFQDYTPHSIEWLSKTSCNIVWSNYMKAVEALCGLSCPIKPHPKKITKPHKTKVRNEETMYKEISEDRGKPKAKEQSVKRSSSSKKKEEAMSTSGSSDSEDSSSDSESSSGSSSSSESSSDSSDESSSDDSSSSSSSSSDSPSEDEEDKKKKKKPVVAKKRQPSSDVSRSQVQSYNDKPAVVSVVQVPDEPEENWEGYADHEDISVPVPLGRWRLGIPYPKTKAIFMRFAHCKEKTTPGFNKPIELYQDFINQRAERRSNRSERSRRMRMDRSPERFERRLEDRLIRTPSKHRRPRPLSPVPDRVLGRVRVVSPPPKPPRLDRKLPDDDQKGYKDLDNPADKNRNPWGFLSQNWGRKETQDNVDYQDLLREHVTGRKRKRGMSDSDDDKGSPLDLLRPIKKASRKRVSKSSSKLHPSQSSGYDTPDSAFDPSDDDQTWRKRINLPVMRMYADDEEKRHKRPTERKKIGSRLSSGWSISRMYKSDKGSDSLDLRSKIRQKKSRR